MIVSLRTARNALQNQGSDSETKEKRFGGNGSILTCETAFYRGDCRRHRRLLRVNHAGAGK
jgi:hypothetical protein